MEMCFILLQYHHMDEGTTPGRKEAITVIMPPPSIPSCDLLILPLPFTFLNLLMEQPSFALLWNQFKSYQYPGALGVLACQASPFSININPSIYLCPNPYLILSFTLSNTPLIGEPALLHSGPR